MREDFAAMILSHRRAKNVRTYQALRNQGYTGKIYIVVDDEDPELNLYRELYGDSVLVFSKEQYDGQFDLADNFEGRGSVVWARNACFDLARSVGARYFVELDDDYTSFRVSSVEKRVDAKDLDAFFEEMVEFLSIDSVSTIAFAQGGEMFGNYIGRVWLKRKAMNSFFCDIEKQFDFIGRLNDDVNTYLIHGQRGKLFFTLMNAQLEQIQTQSQRGGLTEEYLDRGTYVKSFYSVMLCPSCVRVEALKSQHKRLHHRISWNNAVPKIIHQNHRKAA